MRSEAKGWYEAERGFDARCGPDAWRRYGRPGPRAVGRRSVIRAKLSVIRWRRPADAARELERFAGEVDRVGIRWLQQQHLWDSSRLCVAGGRCARGFCLHIAFWLFDQARLVWSAVFLRRLVWRGTLSSPGRFQLGYV